ncbi:uncharacterized protein LOC116424572 [Nomia melanderi]|uniref:uncharacterized protein LOC116424572 n=1 Tax=Nomia melanderi TaxID=2448451 RepID=UPI003FCEDA24
MCTPGTSGMSDTSETSETSETTESSDIIHWTKLPKEISPDFVSIPGDYDYPFYLSEKEEWVHFRNRKHYKGKVTIVSEPFLIMELNRFVPYVKGKYVNFHPLNMPYVSIGKIQILGFVIATFEDVRSYMYKVDDGTGVIIIVYNKKHLLEESIEKQKIDSRYRNYARLMNLPGIKGEKCPERFPNPRPQFKYPPGTSLRDMAILENKWAMETKNGLLGSRIKCCQYLHAIGYCRLDFNFHERPQKEITLKHLYTAKLQFLATKVNRISEQEYNSKMYLWLTTVVQRRYDEHPDKPEKNKVS